MDRWLVDEVESPLRIGLSNPNIYIYIDIHTYMHMCFIGIVFLVYT